MVMQRVGVEAVVEGTARYVQDAQRVNDATARIGRTAEQTAASSRQMADTLRRTGSQMREAGTQAVLLGSAISAPGIIAVATAVQFESAFAGVRKTVDATEAQFASLRQGILDMTERLPASAGEIARVAEAAGQLGIETDNILGFTETMIQLGETTNLSADEAATALARFANIIDLPQDRFDELGSVIVDLGNNLATTEAEIVDLALRIAGAGNVVGLSEDQILAFAGALSSVGLRSEAGGTAISRVLVEIASAVETGGEKLDRFAEVAGLSSEEFTRAFEEDAARATIRFIEGLGGIEAAGGSVFSVLNDLSLADVRVRDALLRAAGAGDLLRTSLDLGAQAAEENTALTIEFGRRVETTAAQLRLLLNDIQRLAIETGDELLPVLNDLIGIARSAVDIFGLLPGPVRGTLVAFALLGGAALVAAGSLGFLVGNALTLIALFPALAAGAATAAASIGALALAAAPFLAAGAAIAAVGFIVVQTLNEASREADDFSHDTREAMEGGAEAIRAQRDEWIALRDAIQADIEQFRAAGRDVSALEDQVTQLNEDIAALTAELKDVATTAEDAVGALDASRGALDADSAALSAAQQATAAFRREQAALAEQLGITTAELYEQQRAAAQSLLAAGREAEAAAGAPRGAGDIADVQAAAAGLFGLDPESLFAPPTAPPAPAAGAGGGGISPFEQTAERRMQEQIEALLRGGESGLQETIRTQQQLDREFERFAEVLRNRFGVQVPEIFRDMFESIRKEALDAGKEVPNDLGNLLSFLVARRLGRGLPGGAGLIAVPPAAQAAAAGGGGGQQITIEQINVGAGTTTGDIAQGVAVGARASFGSLG